MTRRIGQYDEKSGRAYYRVVIGDERPSFPIFIAPGQQARDRCDHIERFVRKWRHHGKAEELIEKLVREAAAAGTDTEFEAVRLVVDDVCGGEFELAPGFDASMTFDDLFWRWRKNELHRLFPDHVRSLKASTAEEYGYLYRTYVQTVLGHLPLSGITVNHAFRVMQQVPADATSNSLRRNTGIIVARPFRLAVFPLRILAQSPSPGGFLPKKKAGRAKVYLYPTEDLRLRTLCPAPRSPTSSMDAKPRGRASSTALPKRSRILRCHTFLHPPGSAPMGARSSRSRVPRSFVTTWRSPTFGGRSCSS